MGGGVLPRCTPASTANIGTRAGGQVAHGPLANMADGATPAAAPPSSPAAAVAAPPPAAAAAAAAAAAKPSASVARKRQIAELEARQAGGETLSKNARKKLLKLRYREEVLPGRKVQQRQQRQQRRKQKKEGRRIQAAATAASGGAVGGAVAGAASVAAAAPPMAPRVAPKVGFAFFEAIGRPRLVAAPMVNQSELPFRLLMRRYGAQLCYTPMIDARSFASSAAYRAASFSTCAADRPLIAQFAGDDPATLLRAALLVQDDVDAVDLNFGCPQGIARRGHYGAFLLDEPDLMCRLVRVLHEGLSVPVTCKVRMLPDDPLATIALCQRLQDAGCSLLTVHGRTRDQKGQMTGRVDWDIIAAVKEKLSIPVIANGGIEVAEDVVRCLEATRADGVMSSEAILACPDLFEPLQVDSTGSVGHPSRTAAAVPAMERQCALAQEYLHLARQHPPSPSATLAGGTREHDTRSNGIIKSHLFKLLYTGLQTNEDLRDRLQFAQTFDEHSDVVADLSKRGGQAPAAAAMSWYRRHRRGEAEGAT